MRKPQGKKFRDLGGIFGLRRCGKEQIGVDGRIVLALAVGISDGDKRTERALKMYPSRQTADTDVLNPKRTGSEIVVEVGNRRFIFAKIFRLS